MSYEILRIGNIIVDLLSFQLQSTLAREVIPGDEPVRTAADVVNASADR